MDRNVYPWLVKVSFPPSCQLGQARHQPVQGFKRIERHLKLLRQGWGGCMICPG